MKRIVLLLLVCTPVTLRSQTFEMGLYGGVSTYEGDLAPNRILRYFETFRPAYGVLARANVARWLTFRAAYTHMFLFGDDAISGRRRGLNFQTEIDEIGLFGELNLFRLHLFGNDFYVEPYLMGGVTTFRFNPQTEYQGRLIDLQPIGTEGQGLPRYQDKYELWKWSLAGGGGVKLRLTDRWFLGLEGSGRIPFTDYLDDVTGNFIVYRDILEGNGELAARLSRPTFDPNRHNPSKRYRRGGPARDYFYSFGATVSYLFGGDGNGLPNGPGIPCPEFQNKKKRKPKKQRY